MRDTRNEQEFTWQGIEAIVKVALMIFGVMYLCSSPWHHVPIRSTLGINTLYQNDSAYVIRSEIDTVYYEPEEREPVERP